MEKVKIKIDGKEYEVEGWMSILRAAQSVGIEIPHFCYHPALRVVATCRLCVVKVEGIPKLQTACSTQVKNGMVIWTNTEEVRRARADALEFLLANHPLDCPQCEKAGECKLQDYAFNYGKPVSRFREVKRDLGKRDISSKITLRPNRCVLCTRCVRYAEEYMGTGGLTVVERGGMANVAVYPEGAFEGDYTLNVTHLCPVGALIPKHYMYKSRPTYLKVGSSICPLCSRGCNVFLDIKGVEPVRVRPRENMEVNYYWLCDYGYLAYQHFKPLNRERTLLVKIGRDLRRQLRDKIIKYIAGELKKGDFSIVITPFLTNEELMAVKVFSEKLGINKIYLLYPEYIKEHEGSELLKPEKAPNMKGVERIFGKLEPETEASGDVFLIGWFFKEPNFGRGVSEIFVHSLKLPSSCREKIEAFVPEAGWGEKEGSFTNWEGRVQWMTKIIDPIGESMDVITLLSILASEIGIDFPYRTPYDTMADLKKVLPGYDVEMPSRGIKKVGVR